MRMTKYLFTITALLLLLTDSAIGSPSQRSVDYSRVNYDSLDALKSLITYKQIDGVWHHGDAPRYITLSSATAFPARYRGFSRVRN
jgi:hypothetical protein